MSWRDAQATARELHAQLRAKHPAGYLRMVLRAWTRILDSDEKLARPSPDAPRAPSASGPSSGSKRGSEGRAPLHR